MRLPALTEPHRRLERLVGSWRGEEKLEPTPLDPQGATAVASVRNVLGLDGFAVVQDYAQERDGRTTLRGHGLFRWDQERQEYVLHWFDSMGQEPTEYRGTFDDGVLSLQCLRAEGRTRAVWDFREPKRHTFRMEVSPDGKRWFLAMEGRYERQW